LYSSAANAEPQTATTANSNPRTLRMSEKFSFFRLLLLFVVVELAYNTESLPETPVLLLSC
jgi:hypothetical protein